MRIALMFWCLIIPGRSQDVMDPMPLEMLDNEYSKRQISNLIKLCGGYDFDVVVIFEGEFPEKAVGYGIKFGQREGAEAEFYFVPYDPARARQADKVRFYGRSVDESLHKLKHAIVKTGATQKVGAHAKNLVPPSKLKYFRMYCIFEASLVNKLASGMVGGMIEEPLDGTLSHEVFNIGIEVLNAMDQHAEREFPEWRGNFNLEKSTLVLKDSLAIRNLATKPE